MEANHSPSTGAKSTVVEHYIRAPIRLHGIIVLAHEDIRRMAVQIHVFLTEVSGQLHVLAAIPSRKETVPTG
jgi:hypothetical protein